MKRLLAFCLVVALHYSARSQQIDYSKFVGQPVEVSFNTRVIDPAFTRYVDDRKDLEFLPIHVASSVPSHSVEALMVDFYRANTVDGLRAVSTDESYREIPKIFHEKADTSRNFLGVVHKLTFRYAGMETAIIKFFDVRDSVQRNYHVLQAQRVNNEWRFFHLKELEDVAEVVRLLKSKTFWEFYNKSESEHAIINELRNQVKNAEGILNISRLAKVILLNKSRLRDFCN